MLKNKVRNISVNQKKYQLYEANIKYTNNTSFPKFQIKFFFFLYRIHSALI